jgi:type II secretory pathway component GspD/PulD (secretin)
MLNAKESSVMKSLTRSIRNLALATLTASLAFTPVTASAAMRGSSTNVTINARNVNLSDLISLIATQAGINVVVDGAVTAKRVTLRLHDIPFADAMATIERGYGLSEAYDHGVLHVGPPDVINRMYPASSSITQTVIPISNADANFVTQALQGVLPIGTIVVADPRTNTVLVKGDPNAVASAAEIVARLDQPRFASASYATVSIPLSNIKATEALSILKTEVQTNSSQSLAASDHPNAILANGSPDFIATARGLLFEIDKPGQQVRFEVRVTDITPNNDNSDIGVLFGGTSASGTVTPGNASLFTQFANKTLPINATLNFLISKSQAKILADPSINTLNNEKATLNVGEQYPLTVFNPQTGTNEVQFVNAGVDLTMTPIIGADGNITVTLDTDYSQILSFVGTYPVIGTRHVTNVFRTGTDQTIVIAGLFEDVTNDTLQKVPLLGDIPILGEVFRNRTTSHTRDEVVFLITPHIVTSSDFKSAADLPPQVPK